MNAMYLKYRRPLCQKNCQNVLCKENMCHGCRESMNGTACDIRHTTTKHYKL
jgi:hypothetical protein